MPGLVVEHQAPTISVLIGNDSDRVGLLSIRENTHGTPFGKIRNVPKSGRLCPSPMILPNSDGKR